MARRPPCTDRVERPAGLKTLGRAPGAADLARPARMSVQKKASTSSAASLPLSVPSAASSASVDADAAPSSSDAYTSRSANSNLRAAARALGARAAAAARCGEPGSSRWATAGSGGGQGGQHRDAAWPRWHVATGYHKRMTRTTKCRPYTMAPRTRPRRAAGGRGQAQDRRCAGRGRARAPGAALEHLHGQHHAVAQQEARLRVHHLRHLRARGRAPYPIYWRYTHRAHSQPWPRCAQTAPAARCRMRALAVPRREPGLGAGPQARPLFSTTGDSPSKKKRSMARQHPTGAACGPRRRPRRAAARARAPTSPTLAAHPHDLQHRVVPGLGADGRLLPLGALGAALVDDGDARLDPVVALARRAGRAARVALQVDAQRAQRLVRADAQLAALGREVPARARRRAGPGAGARLRAAAGQDTPEPPPLPLARRPCATRRRSSKRSACSCSLCALGVRRRGGRARGEPEVD